MQSQAQPQCIGRRRSCLPHCIQFGPAQSWPVFLRAGAAWVGKKGGLWGKAFFWWPQLACKSHAASDQINQPLALTNVQGRVALTVSRSHFQVESARVFSWQCVSCPSCTVKQRNLLDTATSMWAAKHMGGGFPAKAIPADPVFSEEVVCETRLCPALAAEA